MRRSALLLTLVMMPEIARADYDFTTIDVPATVSTVAYGINDSGEIVGRLQSAPFGLPSGFLLSGGVYNVVTVSGAGFTITNGINNAGQIVGTFGANAAADGFVLSGANYETIHVFPRVNSANGINDSARIVGTGVDAQGRLGGFSGDLRSGFSALGFAGGQSIAANGINNAGQTVGQYTDSAGTKHGFLDGVSLNVPGASWTSAQGINGLGQIVGEYADIAGHEHGFMLSRNVFTALDMPGATATEAFGINSLGQVVGGYTDIHSVEHGFLATIQPVPVPEPNSAYLILIGIALSVFTIMRRRRLFVAARGREVGATR